MNELYDVRTMPLSQNIELKTAQEKILNNVPLTLKDKLLLGRDNTITQLGSYEFLPNYVYRCISKELYEIYLKTGYIYGNSENDEYEEYIENGHVYNNNKGVNWYLGGIEPSYGEYIIACPAYKEYFTPAYDNGNHLSINPMVRHMKSSGYKKPVPMNLVKLVNEELDYSNNKIHR